MAKKNNSSDVRFSQDNVLHYHKTRNVFPVEQTDWDRLTGMIKKYPKISLVWWTVFSFFLSLSIELLLNISVIDEKDTKRLYFIFGFGVSVTATVLTFIAALVQKNTEEIKKDDILEEMDRMKIPIGEEFPPEEEGEAIPLNSVEVATSETLKVTRATYGVGDKNVDVTKVLNDLIQGGKLSTTATNALAGDPAPGTPKLLDLEYENKGISLSKTFKENEVVDLP